MSDIKQIYSYIVAQDNGYSPNPFMQRLSLPWCKPTMRKAVAKYAHNHGLTGIWLVGLTRKEKLKYNRLLYLAKITEILTHDEYFHRYPDKRPDFDTYSHLKQVGDNAYYKKDGHYVSLQSMHSHDEAMQQRDLSVEHVLISDYYIYYGEAAQALPSKLEELVVGQGFKSNFSEETKQNLSAFIARHSQQLAKKTIVSKPHIWPSEAPWNEA